MLQIEKDEKLLLMRGLMRARVMREETMFQVLGVIM